MIKQFRSQVLHHDTIYKEFMTEVPKLWHKLSCASVIRDRSGNNVVMKSIRFPVQSNYRMLSHTCICCINLKKKNISSENKTINSD